MYDTREHNHTPGPWFAENGGDKWQVWENEGIAHIADVSRGVEPDLTGEANARLIAAAPELLALCQEILPEVKCRCDEGFTSRGLHEPNSLCEYHEPLRTVIARAKGGTP